MKSWIVTAKEPLVRLDVWLAKTAGLSRTGAQAAIKAGNVQVNDKPERSGYVLKQGDEVSLAVPAAQPVQEVKLPIVTSQPAPLSSPNTPALVVLYEDDEVVVIDKPAGLLVHAGNGREDEPTLAHMVRHYTTDDDETRAGIVHRLDLETSGVMVIARTTSVKKHLQAQWRNRSVRKEYLLLAMGRVEPVEAIIALPLDRDPKVPTRRAVVVGGRPARSHYLVQSYLQGTTLIQAIPATGRTHQLRVHMAAVGHAIAGDTLYGAPVRPFCLTRHFLHASRLQLTLPSGTVMDVHSPLPPDLQEVLEQVSRTL